MALSYNENYNTNNMEVMMTATNKGRITIKGIDPLLRTAIKKQAIDRGIRANDLYLKIVNSGAKRLGIAKDDN